MSKQTYADDNTAVQRQLFLGFYELLFETSTSAECDYIVILNPYGLDAFLKSEFKDNLNVVYLECDEKERASRYFNRDKNKTDLSILTAQYEARLKQDKNDFEGIMLKLINTKFVIYNTTSWSKNNFFSRLKELLG